jgi:hypothetical protein
MEKDQSYKAQTLKLIILQLLHIELQANLQSHKLQVMEF